MYFRGCIVTHLVGGLIAAMSMPGRCRHVSQYLYSGTAWHGGGGAHARWFNGRVVDCFRWHKKSGRFAGDSMPACRNHRFGPCIARGDSR